MPSIDGEVCDLSEFVGDGAVTAATGRFVLAAPFAVIGQPVLENPWHEDRIKTLRKAAEIYAKEPDQFLMLELCV